MVTVPIFLDLDPVRSFLSKLELVQFRSPYLKWKSVQFQIRSSSKIFQTVLIVEIYRGINAIKNTWLRLTWTFPFCFYKWYLACLLKDPLSLGFWFFLRFRQRNSQGRILLLRTGTELIFFLNEPIQSRSIPLSRKGSRSDQDPKIMECDPDRELLRSVPDHVWVVKIWKELYLNV